MNEQQKIDPPPWLVAMVDQRVALMKQSIGELGFRKIKRDMGVLLTPLTEPREGATQVEMEEWNFTCDHCGKVDREGLHAGHHVRYVYHVRVELMFGVCSECAKDFGKAADGDVD